MAATSDASEVSYPGGIFLTWKDLNVSLPPAHGTPRILLHNITGYAEPGQVVAIMGPSGSGKTTLLDTLSGRLSSITKQTGEILVNGRRQQLKFGNLAYVSQDDSLISTLTVYETIMYSAQLQFPQTMTMAEREARVECTINEMGLQSCSHTRIGGWHVRGLSGGEKRRVSIANDILTQPQLLFLDEPTSGLDSAAAFLVMKTLSELARGGRTLIASIHQPSSEVFMLFHTLCLLSGGRTVYFGEAKGAQQFFGDSGFPCPTFRNPSDHFLWVMNSNIEGDIEMGELGEVIETVHSAQKANILVRAYSSSDTAMKVKAQVEKLSSQKGDILKGGREVSFWRQAFYLTRRSFVNMQRDLTYYWFRLIVYMGLALCVGTIYYKVGHTYNSIQARAAFLMFVSSFMSFMGIVGFPSFIDDLKIFTRERLNGHYGVATFAIANTLSSFPFLFLLAVLPGAILYFLGGLHPGLSHFGFFVTTLLVCLVGVEGLLMAVASIVPDFLTGIIAGAGILAVFILNAGFFRLIKDLPKPVWRYPMSYISLYTYANRAFYINDFYGLKFENSEPSRPPISGEEVIHKLLGLDTSYSKCWNVVILLGMAIFYRLLFFVCMKFREQLPSLKEKFKNGCWGPKKDAIATICVTPQEEEGDEDITH